MRAHNAKGREGGVPRARGGGFVWTSRWSDRTRGRPHRRLATGCIVPGTIRARVASVVLVRVMPCADELCVKKDTSTAQSMTHVRPYESHGDQRGLVHEAALDLHD